MSSLYFCLNAVSNGSSLVAARKSVKMSCHGEKVILKNSRCLTVVK